jgi:hypothetical protein
VSASAIAGAGSNWAALKRSLIKQVAALKSDLRERAGSAEAGFAEGLRADHQRAKDAERTSYSYELWLEGQLEQAAVAWVLATVFLRWVEDNELISDPYLAGPGDRLQTAMDRQTAYFVEHPDHNHRHWLVSGLDRMAMDNNVVGGLFDRKHNPMWTVEPSTDGAKALLDFWRTRGADGEPVYTFVDGKWDTRFLGDLYQDLSEHARKKYALLQTPEFIQNFILDHTLTPALKTFGLSEDFRIIDPACGSGHFLLGSFQRLLSAWREATPQADIWDLIRRALASVHGVDKNPFAAEIARFRLLIAAMKVGGVKTLADAPGFDIVVAVGDSLLHGRGAPRFEQDLFAATGPVHTYLNEDVRDYESKFDILGLNSYHAVVGNPPYITVKDPQENVNYRKGYPTCSGKYALLVPFLERFFRLAKWDNGDEAGYTGILTANSFMKREFGKKLIEEFFNGQVHLTHVVDTSGAYIPGHGTPTVILFGQNRPTRQLLTIRAVLGVRGEPDQPTDPAEGLVWRAIVDQIGRQGSESEWVSVEDAERSRFAAHPWSISGGGAGGLVKTFGKLKGLGSLHADIGMTGLTLEDEVFALSEEFVRRFSLVGDTVQLVVGDELRDFVIARHGRVLMPNSWDGTPTEPSASAVEHFWRYRSGLRKRLYFGRTPEQRGLRWFDLGIFFARRHATLLSIAFGFVATHNHFVLDRGAKVFNRTAPVIKLPEGASEDDHLALLGVLNSSTACFWLKQVCHDKGNGGIGGGIASEDWEKFYEFTGTKLQEFPLPTRLPLEKGRSLDAFARRAAALEPEVVCNAVAPTRGALDAARAAQATIRAQMIALHEELDWETYRLYGLLTEAEAKNLLATSADLPELSLGERAFEIILARQIEGGNSGTQWFARHHSTPITEIPNHWTAGYRQVVQARIDLIERRSDIALIERPECKRRWASTPWEKKEEAALKSWLLDRLENRDLWFADRDGADEPRLLSVNQLADALRGDKDFFSVAALYAADHLEKRDADLADIVKAIVDEEHVPYLAAMRYKDPAGLWTRAAWEKTWDLQRQEGETGERLAIDVPPKYTSADFRKPSYWKNRGRLDVPKERFISYLEAGTEGDTSLVLGWAGWDHREQAHALATLAVERSQSNGWDAVKVTPILAGLAEQMPWVKQWHSGYDASIEADPAEAYQAILDSQMAKHSVTDKDLKAWRPAAASRGRAAKK